MAVVYFSLRKIIIYLENVSKSCQTCIRVKKKSLSNYFLGIIENKPLIFLPSLTGIIRKSEINNEFWDPIEEVVHRLTLATISLKDGNVEKSEKMLLKSLNLAETNNFPPGVIFACDILSSLSIKSRDYERAEDFLIQALDNLPRLGIAEDDNIAVSFHLKLSRVYSSNGNNELAEISFKNCIRLQKKKLENCSDNETNVLWMIILYWYGKFLFDNYRFKEAKTCFKDCYLASLKLGHLMPNQRMVILYNLGEICQILGEHEEAIDYFLNGISIDKKGQNSDLAYFYIKLGRIFMFRELYKDARDWCSQGNELARRHHNSDAEKQSNDCLKKIKNVLVP